MNRRRIDLIMKHQVLSEQINHSLLLHVYSSTGVIQAIHLKRHYSMPHSFESDPTTLD